MTHCGKAFKTTDENFEILNAKVKIVKQGLINTCCEKHLKKNCVKFKSHASAFLF